VLQRLNHFTRFRAAQIVRASGHRGGYSWRAFAGDLFGGLIAALIALPYGLALAVAVGSSTEPGSRHLGSSWRTLQRGCPLGQADFISPPFLIDTNI
jgi:hypothetical protein